MLVSAVTASEILMAEIGGSGILHADGADFRFLQNDGKYVLDVPEGYAVVRSCILQPEESMILLNQASQETLQLYFSSSEGWHQFRRVICGKDVITIGTGIEDDLHIRSDFLQESCIRIDLQHNSICVNPGIPAALNGVRISSSAVFLDGDVLDCLNLRILLHHAFLWFSSCLNLSCILPEADITEVSALNSAVRINEEPLPLLRMPVLPEPVLLEGLKDIAEREHRPVILSIGPALTMAAASLAAGILMTWNSIRNGAAAASVLPSVLLPLMMILSTAAWTPLSMRYEKKLARRRKEQRIQDYLQKLNGLRITVRQRKQNYADELNHLFTEQHKAMFRLEEDPEQIYLRTGTVIAHALVTIADPNPSEDPRIREAVAHLRTEADIGLEIPFLIDLKKRHMIRVAGRNRLGNFKSLFLRAAGMKLPLVLLFEEDTLRQIYDLLDQPALFAADGTRHASGNPEQDLQLLSLLEEKQEYVLFSLRRSRIPEKLKKDCRILSIISVFDTDADLILDTGDGQGRILDAADGSVHSWCADLADNRITHVFYPHPVPQACRKNSFLSMYGAVHAGQLEIRKRWDSFHAGSLPALLGIQADGQKIVLDLSEAMDGPHGLIAGTTGSGKSELLITLILSLAIQCPPEQLQFILIDFKGGGACSAIAQGTYPLPHVAGMLTNLDEDSLHRAQLSFTCECRRREQLFERLHRSTGRPVRNLQEYSMYRIFDADLPVLAELVIVVDEFAQLKSECPDFLKELLMISRIGRSLGIHLILATQKPGGVVSDEIRANTRFRICMRVSERSDSMEVLHSSEGAELKDPGDFLLQKQNGILRGRCAYANAEISSQLPIALLNLQHTEARFMHSEAQQSRTELLSVLEEINRCRASKAHVRPIWLPPLQELHFDDLPEAADTVFAKTDDILRCRQEWLSLKPEDGPAVFFSGSIGIRKMVQDTILGVFLHAQPSIPVLMISADGTGPAGVSCAAENEHARLCGMLRMLRETAVSRRNPAVLLISDVSSFLKADEDNPGLLLELCSEWEKLRTVPILLASGSNVLSWRLLNVLKKRFCMGDVSRAEIASILSHAPQLKAYAPECGYTAAEEKCILFRMLKTEPENLPDMSERKELLKIPDLPEMPVCTGHDTDTVIGYSLKDCYPVRIVRKLLILSSTNEEVRILFDVLGSHILCLCEYPQMTSQPYVLFLTFREAEENKLMNRWDGDVLLIGEGASEQYYYPSSRIRLKKGEGFRIAEEGKEKILLVLK